MEKKFGLGRFAIVVGMMVTAGGWAVTAYAQTPERPDSYDSSAPGAAHPPAPASTAPKGAPNAMAQKVRAAIAGDNTLSEQARKVKVTEKNGKVTLTGAVVSPDERSGLVAKASEVAGEGNVVDKLKVTGKE